MDCFHGEQTAGCQANGGVWGNNTAELRDKLTGCLIGLARATEGNEYLLSDSTADVVVEGLAATLPDGNLDDDALLTMIKRVDAEKRKLVPACYQCASSCGRTDDYDMGKLRDADEDICSLKTVILLGIRGLAVCAHHAAALGYKDDSVHNFLYKGLFAIGMDDWDSSELLPILLEVGEVNLRCAAMLEQANAETLVLPRINAVRLTIRNAPELGGRRGCGDDGDAVVLCWHEQKTVCILMTLLHMGIRNVHLDSPLPAYLTPNVWNILAEKSGIALI